MKADVSSADAYVTYDLPVDQSEVWLTLSCFWDAVAQAVWEAEEFSGDFGLLKAHNDVGGTANANGASLGVQSAVNKWYQDRSASHFGPAATNDVTYLVEIHYSRGVTTAVYIDGTLIDTVVVDGDAIRDVFQIQVGQANGTPNDPGAIAYIDDVKLGTSRGGTELFSADFDDGTFDAWTTTVGDVSLVGSGGSSRRVQLGMQYAIVKRRTSVYFDNVKVGSTLGGSDYIDNDFESGF